MMCLTIKVYMSVTTEVGSEARPADQEARQAGSDQGGGGSQWRQGMAEDKARKGLSG